MKKINSAWQTRIGDKVMFYNDESLSGTIVGYDRCKKYISRAGVPFGMQPGVYEYNGIIIVQWDNNTSSSVYNNQIYLCNDLELEYRKSNEAYYRAFNTVIYKGKLPYTPVYEGDVVMLVSRDKYYRYVGIVQRIDYKVLNLLKDDGTQFPCFTMAISDGTIDIRNKGYTIITYKNYTRDDLGGLVKRGNYWNYEHGHPLNFSSTDEKFKFYDSMGWCKPILNHDNETDGTWHLSALWTPPLARKSLYLVLNSARL